MLIGFRLDLTDLAFPPERDSLEPGREGFCMGVSKEKEGARGERKRESGLKKGGVLRGVWGGGGGAGGGMG